MIQVKQKKEQLKEAKAEVAKERKVRAHERMLQGEMKILAKLVKNSVKNIKCKENCFIPNSPTCSKLPHRCVPNCPNVYYFAPQ